MNNSLQAIELINPEDFKLEDLFQKLFEKIRANHPAIRILIVSWITFLDTIPEIKIIKFLHELLPGLFNMLCDKTKDVNQSADKCLKHFLKEIDSQFEVLPSTEVLYKILEIVIEQCKNTNEQARITAFDWLFMFITKYLNSLSNLPNKTRQANYIKIKSSNNIISFKQEDLYNNQSSNFLQNEFSFKQSTKNVLVGESDNQNIDKIPFYLFPKMLDAILYNVNSTNEQILSLAYSSNAALIKMVDYLALNSNSLNVKSFEDVLKNYFESKKESTIDLILNWIIKLFRKFHEEMFTRVDLFIENFTNILSDNNESVSHYIIITIDI